MVKASGIFKIDLLVGLMLIFLKLGIREAQKSGELINSLELGFKLIFYFILKKSN